MCSHSTVIMVWRTGPEFSKMAFACHKRLVKMLEELTDIDDPAIAPVGHWGSSADNQCESSLTFLTTAAVQHLQNHLQRMIVIDDRIDQPSTTCS